MNKLRALAIAVLALAATVAVFAPYIAPATYDRQFRDEPNAAPSAQHMLGTDDLGRDRFSRLIYATRISLALAPAAALLATLLAALIGGPAGFYGGWVERGTLAFTDLFLSLPWMFLLLLVRAAMPLNVEPEVSITITFAMLGLLGWAASARVICAGARSFMQSDMAIQAAAAGIGRWRMLWIHLLPNLKPVLLAQFIISVPAFILAEANLGVLGLGVIEPLPSWGGLLRELEGYRAFSLQPWLLVPLILLVVVVSSFQLLLNKEEIRI
jgi:peptide/nickel transport system permease protein